MTAMTTPSGPTTSTLSTADLLKGASKGLRRRKTSNTLATIFVWFAFLLALLPLYSVLSFTVSQGIKRFDWNFLTHSMKNVGPLDKDGGAYHAIIGTLEQVGLASLVAIPLGLLCAIYLVEYGRGKLRAAIRFFVDVMTGIPSIVAGLFVYAFWVLALKQGFSGLAAAMALAILMLPTVIRSSEELLMLVPQALREAGLGLGLPRWRVVISLVLPTAISGIVTGIMLAIARVIGETAPLLLTCLGLDSVNNNPFDGQQSGLGLYVFGQAQRPAHVAIDRAWAGALTLILVVMLLSLIARLIARRTAIRT